MSDMANESRSDPKIKRKFQGNRFTKQGVGANVNDGNIDGSRPNNVTTPPQTTASESVSPPPQEVCLRWNSYFSNMQVTFSSLLDNEQLVDVTLACEGRSIKCHKMMLSACSSYFAELLSQNPCKHPIVFMKDLKFWEVQALIDFMYHGEVSVSHSKVQSLLAAAEALQIKGLAASAFTLSSRDEDSISVTSENFNEVSVPSSSGSRRGRKRKMTPQPSTSINQQDPLEHQPRTSICTENVKQESEEQVSLTGDQEHLDVEKDVKQESVEQVSFTSDQEYFDVEKTYSGSAGGGNNADGVHVWRNFVNYIEISHTPSPAPSEASRSSSTMSSTKVPPPKRAPAKDSLFRLDGKLKEHVMSKFPALKNNKHPTRKCRVCLKNKKVSATVWYCIKCGVPLHPGTCYTRYHTCQVY